ncbi:TonB-dependent receptor [Gammaproteobacteria bacterium]|nr:TonB-dependent receptor [Gammaproteobacteria bacterium]
MFHLRNRHTHKSARLCRSIFCFSALQLAIGTATAATALEEIVVTAQKRSQDLQEVSLPVTAVGNQRLQSAQIFDLEDLQYVLPSVSFANNNGVAKIFIRGIGLNDSTAGIDPSVALHVDGAVINDPTAHFTSLFDLERVEALRGPQGILYGRNATGGSINLITAKPTRDMEGYGRATLGNYGLLVTEGAVSGPMSEMVSGRLAFRKLDRDGYAENEVTGTDTDNADQFGLRGLLQFDFSQNLDLLLSGEYYEEDDRALGLNFARATFPAYATDTSLTPAEAASIAPLGLGGFPIGERNFASEEDPKNVKETWSVTSTLSWDINDLFSFVNITNYREVDGLFVQDLDMSGVANRFDVTGNAPTINTRNINSEQFTTELQLHFAGERLTGLAALYYFTQDMDGDNRSGLSQYGGLPGLTQQRVVLTGTSEADSWSIFTNFSYLLNDEFTLKFGGRYTEEKRSIDNENTIAIFSSGPAAIGQPLNNFLTINPSFSDSNTTTDFSPMLGLEWRPLADHMFYYTYAEGFKSAVGLIGQTVNGIVKPETIQNHEFGLKSTWLEGSLITNVAAFSYELQDLQLGRTLPAGGGGAGFVNRFENAAELEAKGLEVEVFWQASDRLVINAAIAWLDAEFSEFDTVDQFDPCLILTTCVAPVLSWAGNRPRSSPEWAYNLHGEYDFPLSNGVITLAGDISYKDEQFYSEFNNDIQRTDAYTLLDSQLRYTPNDERWAVSLWGKNITDELVPAGQFAVSLSRTVGYTYLPPRTWGLTFDYNF